MVGFQVWQCETLALSLPFKPLTMLMVRAGDIQGPTGWASVWEPFLKLDFSDGLILYPEQFSVHHVVQANFKLRAILCHSLNCYECGYEMNMASSYM